MEESLHALVIEDDGQMAALLSRVLKRIHLDVTTVGDGNEGLKRAQNADLILTDLNLPGRSGIDILKSIRSHDTEVPVFVLTGNSSIETAIQALREGATDYIVKPFNMDYITHQLEQAIDNLKTRRELHSLRQALRADPSLRRERLLGRSDAMLRLNKTLSRVAGNDVPVLIQGETGTGKELVANEIHERSERRDKPFIAVNCGAIAENLLESELFGHKRGSFTGASSDKKGLFEAAEGGTLFLDEVGETPQVLQVKLLRVLQEREIRPVGSTRSVPINVRVISATNRSLTDEIEEGNFRQDLFYRISVFPVSIPSLRERLEDIPLLAMSFLDRCSRDYNTTARSIAPEALKALVSYAWPGNVRELQNVMVRAATLTDGDEVQLSALPAAFHQSRIVTNDLESHLPTLEEVERQHIERVLIHCDGNKKRASELLGINRSTLYRKCKQYGFDV